MPTRPQTPDYLIPQMGVLPVSSTRYYQTATITGVLGHRGPTKPISGALSVPPPSTVAAGAPSIGVLLTHQQSWIIAGTALGPLLHSVCLAPGEITQIAVHNQARTVAQKSVDTGIQRDDTTATGSKSTDVDQTERTNASSAAAGFTLSTSISSSMEAAAGGLAGLVGVSGGASSTMANSNQASVNTGTRAVSDQANQNVHQLARDQAQASRSKATAAVREVAESDAVEINTRVIANYNHMHALTMQYFEVEQVYQLRTRVTDAERLIFIPMRVINFSDAAQADAAISRYRSELMAVAGDLGLHHVVAKLAAARLGTIDAAADAAPLGVTQAVEAAIDAAKEAARAVRAGTGTSKGRRAKAQEAGQESSQEDAAQAEIAREAERVRAAEAAAQEPVTALTPAETAADRDARRVKELTSSLETAVTDRGTAQKDLDSATDAVAAARDALRDARDGKLLEKSRAQRGLQQAMAVADTARDTLTARTAAVAAVEEQLRTANWEVLQRRLAADLDDEDLRETLDAHRLAVNQGLWLRLDPSVTAGFLQRHTFAGDPLGDTVDPTPVAVSGDLLGFRWRFRDAADEEAFTARHLSDGELEHSVSVPTGGLFGEAVLGTSNGAERIDLTRFWNWKDALPPIRPAQIATQEVTAPTTLNAPGPANVQESQLKLPPVEFAATSSNMPAVAAMLANPDLFRDMSGQETTAALAKSAMELSADGASSAAQLASDNFARFLQFQHVAASTLLDAAKTVTKKAGAAKGAVDPTLAGGALNAKRAAGDSEASAGGALGKGVDLVGSLVKKVVGESGSGTATATGASASASGSGTASGSGSTNTGTGTGTGTGTSTGTGTGTSTAGTTGAGITTTTGTTGSTPGVTPPLEVEFDTDEP